MIAILYLLDTNILIALIREDRLGDYIRRAYDLFMMEPRPIFSIVTEAELRAFAARQNTWGERQFVQMEFFLQYFKRRSIEPSEIMEAYVEIDIHSLDNGRSMGKNDLWIAATANALDAHLLTTDKDFDHLDPLFLTHTYIDPKTA